jgi:hypothetical protein
MQPPMVGSWSVLVHSVRPFTIHGDLYYELTVQREGDASTAVILRVPQHATAGEPIAGERLTVTFLMGQVTRCITEKHE